MKITLLNLDCFEVLKHMKPVRMIFADPPDNIGHKYNTHNDKTCPEDYAAFIRSLIWEAPKKCEVFWLSFNTKHVFMLGHLVHHWLAHHPDWEAKFCAQTFTFYQHNKHDLGDGLRPLIRLMKKGTEIYPDQIRVPSWRLLNGDKRANPNGKVPSTVFNFPRVTGNSKQRRTWMSTQLHEGLYERCIRLCCKEGDTVADLFAGSGTLARVADRCEVNALLVDIDPLYCEHIAAEHDLKWDEL